MDGPVAGLGTETSLTERARLAEERRQRTEERRKWEERLGDERGALLLKAADAYLKAIAIGFPDRETQAKSRVEYAELGTGRKYARFGLGFSTVDTLAKRPSGGIYARQAEQILRQMVKGALSEDLRLWNLLLRAVEAQGLNVWEGHKFPSGWQGKKAMIEARIAEVNVRRDLRGQAGTRARMPPAVHVPAVPVPWEVEDAYGPDWPELSKRAKERDGYRCAECGTGEGELNVHHIIPLSQGGPNELDNLITLCRSCHANFHPHMTTE